MTPRERLEQGLAHFDNFIPTPSDDSPIFAMPEGNNTLYEFALEERVLTVGDLRDILKELQA